MLHTLRGMAFMALAGLSTAAAADFDLDDAFVAGVYSIGFGGEGAAWDGSGLWIADPEGLAYKRFVVTSSGLSLDTSRPYPVIPYQVGMAWDGAYLWTDADALLRQIDPATGAVIRSIPGGGSFGGLTFDGTYLWKVVRPDIRKIDPMNGAIVDVIFNPPGIPWIKEDLAWDGEYLYLVAYAGFTDARIFKIDPSQKIVVGQPFPLPTGTYNGLAFDGENLWVIGFEARAAYKIAPRVLNVEIDVKPGSEVNPVMTRSGGIIPVALLTTDTFDALTVDESTLAFGPGEAPIAHAQAHIEDVDFDGDMDLLMHFRVSEVGLSETDEFACLAARLSDGRKLQGCDSVSAVPRHRR